jgi:hypothetical protein
VTNAGNPLLPAHAFDVEEARRRLGESGGGYEVVHASPGIELGVYVLVAPEPDRSRKGAQKSREPAPFRSPGGRSERSIPPSGRVHE